MRDATLRCTSIDVSASGMLIALPFYCRRPTQRVVLRFRLDVVELELTAVIARVDRDRSTHLWGLSFRAVDRDTRQMLSNYVRCALAAARAHCSLEPTRAVATHASSTRAPTARAPARHDIASSAQAPAPSPRRSRRRGGAGAQLRRRGLASHFIQTLEDAARTDR